MTDQPTDLRDRIVAAMRRAPFEDLRADWNAPNGPLKITARIDDLADAVLAVLPAFGNSPNGETGPKGDSKSTDGAALRDRIRRAVCEAEGFAWDSDMLEPDEYGDHADMVLAVLPADRGADDLAIARATNQRLNLRAQRLESELAAYRRAVAGWEISETGTYVPLRTLAVIAKAAGLDVPERWELHYERVERAEAELRRLAVEAQQPGPEHALTVRYRNHRGETADRTVLPIRLWYGATEWHPEEQWLLRAFDVDRGAERDFALADMQGARAAEAQQREPLPSIHANDVQGFCPACGHGVLMLGEGGHVVCTLIDCPNPDAVDELLRGAEAQQQPDTETQTPCDQPNACDPDTGELCATHEEEKAHADGEHEYCGVTCEVAMPTELMRNSLIAWSPPGGKGILAELERRAAAGGTTCLDPIECSHEAALGEAQQQARRLGLMVDEYGAGASALTDKLKRARDMHRETCPWAQGKAPSPAFRCGMCDVLDAPAMPVQQPVAADTGEEAEVRGGRVVAYRDPNVARVLLCREHGLRYVGMVPVTAEELPDGGICTFGRLSSLECGRDVLIDPKAP